MSQATKKRKKAIKTKKSSKAVEPIEEPLVEETPIITPTPNAKKRTAVTPEKIMTQFDALMKKVEEEIDARRGTKDKGIKFLRTVNKDIKALSRQAARAMKHKRLTPANQNSGFKKPVAISKDLAKFGGWEHETEISRSDVTKFIAKYIRDHQLYNPNDKREFTPDAKLAKLLNFDKKSESEPLNYWKLQTRMKHLFPKTTPNK